jgi:type IV pilus assembly protein PilF
MIHSMCSTRLFRRLVALAFGLSVASWLVGCATSAAGSAVGAGQDIVTDVDRSPARKLAAIRLELALGYFQQGKSAIALDEVKRSLAADPTFFDAFNLRGLIYMAMNDSELAVTSFQEALRIKPNNPEVLHNLGWLKCQQGAFEQSFALFGQALSERQYAARSKTWMAQGLCEIRAGEKPKALTSLYKAHELDPGNPVIGYNLASLLYQAGEFERARFYVRRINNSALANAESLWLGVRIEKRLGNQLAMTQLGSQLEKRFAQAPETAAWHRGAFDE